MWFQFKLGFRLNLNLIRFKIKPYSLKWFLLELVRISLLECRFKSLFDSALFARKVIRYLGNKRTKPGTIKTQNVQINHFEQHGSLKNLDEQKER